MTAGVTDGLMTVGPQISVPFFFVPETIRMRFTHFTKNTLVSLAIAGMLLPHACLMADELPNPARPSDQTTIDVKLGIQDALRGSLVDTSGKPASAVSVFLIQNGQIEAAGASNENGQFAVVGVPGGKYQIVAGDRIVNVRCWSSAAAPPHAVASALIQVNDVRRGQVHPGTCMFANPWVIAGVAASAVLIPLGIRSIRDNRDVGNSSAGDTDAAS